MPTPRGLSQAPTSFIGSWCLDIHRLPLVACHTYIRNNKIATKMLASTIQFSKYGQEHQPKPPLPSERILEGKTHPRRHNHQEFGEGWPQPHTTLESAKIQCGSGLKKPNHPCYQGRPDSSGPNSAPRPFTPPHSRSTPHLRRESAVLVRSVEIPA